MRRVGAVLVAVIAIGGILYMTMRSNRARDESADAARLDRDVAGQEEARGRIDPHGPATASKVSSPLRLTARLHDIEAGSAQLDIEVATSVAFPAVHVLAQRYDVGATFAQAVVESLWSGSLEPRTSQRLTARVHLGSSPPARLVVTARATGEGGALFATSDIVTLQPEPAAGPLPSGGVMEFPGQTDTLREHPIVR